jgi:hypothetical protein
MENESNKQTAVDFIFSQLPDEYTTTRQGFEVYKQAKEMEKDQIENAYEIGFADAWDDARYDDEPTYIGAEQYYNEKYGKTFLDLVSDEESQVHEVVRKLKEKKIK